MAAAAADSAADILIVIAEAHRDFWASLHAARGIRNDSLTNTQYISQVCCLWHQCAARTRTQSQLHNETAQTETQVLSPRTMFVFVQLCTFLTAYQLLNDGNRLAVIASEDDRAACLYSDMHLLLDPDAPREGDAAAVQVASKLRDHEGAQLVPRNAWW
jgi:hypothetical protein